MTRTLDGIGMHIAVLTTVLCGCTTSTSIFSDGQTSAQLPDELLVGVVMPLSGKYSQGPDDPNWETSFDEVGDAAYNPVTLIVRNGAFEMFE